MWELYRFQLRTFLIGYFLIEKKSNITRDYSSKCVTFPICSLQSSMEEKSLSYTGFHHKICQYEVCFLIVLVHAKKALLLHISNYCTVFIFLCEISSNFFTSMYIAHTCADNRLFQRVSQKFSRPKGPYEKENPEANSEL